MSQLSPEWVMFLSNMIMFSYSQQVLLEELNSKKGEMNSKIDVLSSSIVSLQKELRDRRGGNSSNSGKNRR